MSNVQRILVIDDHRAIHEDFRKILAPSPRVSEELNALESELFDDSMPSEAAVAPEGFELVSAYQGQEGLELVRKAEADGKPFAVAFVDVRMPPGWDGIETIARLWEVSPRLQAVICTAYSDYSWEQIVEKLSRSDGLVLLRKPFDPMEVQRLARELTEKWGRDGEA